MTAEEDKKRRERAALDHLLAEVDIGTTVLEIIEGEAPDFVLRLADGSTVGVEVVELADPELASGMAGYRRLKKALFAALDAARLNVFIHVSTRDAFIPSLNEPGVTRSHVSGLVQLAREHIERGRGRRKYGRSTLRKHGVEWLLYATIEAKAAPEVVGGAQVMGFGMGDHVQERVDKKSAKAGVYRASVGGPVWLLLVAGVRFASGVWSEVVRDQTLRSPFDRVFYVDAYDGAAFEVETTSPSSG